MLKIYQTGDLKIFSDRLGHVYGTEDWCMFLYSLVKMQKPQTIVELGAGCGVSSLWIAQAIKENEIGHLFTYDDGRDWENVLDNNQNFFLEDEKISQFKDYMDHLTKKFELSTNLTLSTDTLPPLPQLESRIDMLFSDFMHGPNDILQILGHFLPNMSPASSLFIDSAPTSFPSYALLELIVNQLNQGKIAQSLMQQVDENKKQDLLKLVNESRFLLIHLTESKNRPQNSTAWIKIEPVDIRPYPKARFH